LRFVRNFPFRIFRILEDKISFQTHIKENARDYCGEIPSIYRLFTDLTREEKEAIIVLIQAFKKADESPVPKRTGMADGFPVSPFPW